MAAAGGGDRRPRFEVVDTPLRRDLTHAVRSSFFADEMPRDHQVAVAALYATGHLEEALSGNGLLDDAVSRRAEERLADDPLASRLHYVASSLVNMVSVTGGVQAGASTWRLRGARAYLAARPG